MVPNFGKIGSWCGTSKGEDIGDSDHKKIGTWGIWTARSQTPSSGFSFLPLLCGKQMGGLVSICVATIGFEFRGTRQTEEGYLILIQSNLSQMCVTNQDCSSVLHPKFTRMLFFFLRFFNIFFYCCSSIVVSIFSPPLSPTAAVTTGCF